jgi:hypothetical protein
MKEHLDSNNERPDNRPGSGTPEKAPLSIDDKNKLEKDLADSYISDLNFQLDTEGQIEEDFARTKDTNLRESLIGLRESGEGSLRELSAKTVKIFNSNKLVVKLRDYYIQRRGRKIYEELNVENNLAREEDYDNFLRTIQSDFWGSSSLAEVAVFGASSALEAIAQRFPEKREEILKIWPTTFGRKIPVDYDSGFDNFINEIRANDYDPLTNFEEKVKFIKTSDDFVALKCLSLLGGFYSRDFDFPEELESRLDSIISKYPGLKMVPSKSIERLIFGFAANYPDRVLADSRRVELIFKLWMNKLDGAPSGFQESGLPPALADRLRNCSEEESIKIIKILLAGWNNSSYISLHWLLDLIPIDKDGLKIIKKHKDYANDPMLSLKRDETLGQDTADKRLELMIQDAGNLGNKGDDMIFISNLIASYPSMSRGIDDKALEKVLNAMREGRPDRFDIDSLHSLNELMNRHNWSDDLKIKVFSMNNLWGKILNSILTGREREKYAWTESEPLLISQLQRDFHKRAEANDLRHYFYEVLDNKQTSDNLDDLIKSYGRSEDGFDFEEIKSLFLDKRIDRKYIEYFIDKISVVGILEGIDNNNLSQDDSIWLLESTIKYGQASNSAVALRKLFELENDDNPARRLQLIDSLATNVLTKIDRLDDSDHYTEVFEVSRQVLDKGLTDFLSKEEADHLGKKVMSGALDLRSNSSAIGLVLRDPDRIKDFFAEDSERREYLIKLLNRLIDDTGNKQYSILISSYFRNPELFNVLDEGYLRDLEDKIFSLNVIDRSDVFLRQLAVMDSRQKERFIGFFEKDYSVSSAGNNIVNSLCQDLVNSDSFFSNQEIYTRIYLKLLNDPDLKSAEASVLFKKPIIFSDDKIRDAFFAHIIRWPGIDGTKILESLASGQEEEKNFSLSLEELKKMSTAVMENRGLSPRFWRGYLKSDKENPTFYLDKDIFRTGINNIGSDCTQESGKDIVAFLQSLSESEFEFSHDDAQVVIMKVFKLSGSIDYLESFYKYDPSLMEDILLSGNYYTTALKADLNYSQDFNNKLLDYVFSQQFQNGQIDALLHYLKKNNNSEMILNMKRRLVTSDQKQQIIAKKSLLKYDLLDVEESRAFYKEITSSSSDNARTQILNSINIIGSMLSNRNNVEQLGSFLDKPRLEDARNLKDISDFIERYSQENKGRSIAVMLFAREYLPDRPLKEVIERVANSLRKYEEIIENNSYRKIPDGFRVSIGMEYEITSSTATGYEELTSQPSLKSDIALISEAARIGSGKDSVHEIATRPTDNPYLMLLEMKLLHDIEYIDLNFDRSEDYQKGARGFHLTIGGEKGLSANPETNFLQNSLIAASWGGVQSGETGQKANGGRGVSLRNRDIGSNNNVAFFKDETSSVELRSLSIDKQETLQRAVTTAFNGAVAIQAFKKCFSNGSLEVLELLKTDEGRKRIDEILSSEDKKVSDLARLWLDLVSKIDASVKKHNESFLDREMFGYLDDNGIWIDAADFGGEYNQKRFRAIIENIDPTLSLEEYVKTTEISNQAMFQSFNVELSDKLTKINNLYLKPGTVALAEDKKPQSIFKGDQANAISMLEVTKLGNSELEYYQDDFLDRTVFDSAGEKRKGYYYLQGASELMLTHAVQRALLDFNSQIEKMLN